ncbi:hypothetical protein D3C76_1310720 [compost metagenome]|jgi:hypothetical protein
MIDRVDQHRYAKGVRQQDEFLAHLAVALVAGLGQETYPFKPLLLGQFNLADKRMQVPHQALHDLFVARIGCISEAVHGLLADQFFHGVIVIGHCFYSDMC